MKTIPFISQLSIITALAAVMGCSTPGPTTAADHMRAHATGQQAAVDQQKQYADEWENGNKLVSEGTRDMEQGADKVRKGEESITAGNAQIVQGENKLEKGREKMRNAQQGFQESNPGVDLQTNR